MFSKTLNVFVLCLLSFICIVPRAVYSQKLMEIELLEPQTDGGKPLMQVLKDRKTTREFSDKELPAQVLSNLLWSAFGINRPESGKRTAPSAVNWQEIDIYVVMEKGCYLYDASEHVLKPVFDQDLRASTGKQPFVDDAPINLVYVADFSRMGTATQDQKVFYSAADAGFISQNVYLFCASEGLGTVVRGLIDREVLAEKMNLGSDQNIILAQTVGFSQK